MFNKKPFSRPLFFILILFLIGITANLYNFHFNFKPYMVSLKYTFNNKNKSITSNNKNKSVDTTSIRRNYVQERIDKIDRMYNMGHMN